MVLLYLLAMICSSLFIIAFSICYLRAPMETEFMLFYFLVCIIAMLFGVFYNSMNQEIVKKLKQVHYYEYLGEQESWWEQIKFWFVNEKNCAEVSTENRLKRTPFEHLCYTSAYRRSQVDLHHWCPVRMDLEYERTLYGLCRRLLDIWRIVLFRIIFEDPFWLRKRVHRIFRNSVSIILLAFMIYLGSIRGVDGVVVEDPLLHRENVDAMFDLFGEILFDNNGLSYMMNNFTPVDIRDQIRMMFDDNGNETVVMNVVTRCDWFDVFDYGYYTFVYDMIQFKLFAYFELFISNNPYLVATFYYVLDFALVYCVNLLCILFLCVILCKSMSIRNFIIVCLIAFLILSVGSATSMGAVHVNGRNNADCWKVCGHPGEKIFLNRFPISNDEYCFSACAKDYKVETSYSVKILEFVKSIFELQMWKFGLGFVTLVIVLKLLGIRVQISVFMSLLQAVAGYETRTHPVIHVVDYWSAVKPMFMFMAGVLLLIGAYLFPFLTLHSVFIGFQYVILAFYYQPHELLFVAGLIKYLIHFLIFVLIIQEMFRYFRSGIVFIAVSIGMYFWSPTIFVWMFIFYINMRAAALSLPDLIRLLKMIFNIDLAKYLHDSTLAEVLYWCGCRTQFAKSYYGSHVQREYFEQKFIYSYQVGNMRQHMPYKACAECGIIGHEFRGSYSCLDNSDSAVVSFLQYMAGKKIPLKQGYTFSRDSAPETKKLESQLEELMKANEEKDRRMAELEQKLIGVMEINSQLKSVTQVQAVLSREKDAKLTEQQKTMNQMQNFVGSIAQDVKAQHILAVTSAMTANPLIMERKAKEDDDSDSGEEKQNKPKTPEDNTDKNFEGLLVDPSELQHGPMPTEPFTGQPFVPVEKTMNIESTESERSVPVGRVENCATPLKEVSVSVPMEVFTAERKTRIVAKIDGDGFKQVVRKSVSPKPVQHTPIQVPIAENRFAVNQDDMDMIYTNEMLGRPASTGSRKSKNRSRTRSNSKGSSSGNSSSSEDVEAIQARRQELPQSVLVNPVSNTDIEEFVSSVRPVVKLTNKAMTVEDVVEQYDVKRPIEAKETLSDVQGAKITIGQASVKIAGRYLPIDNFNALVQNKDQKVQQPVKYGRNKAFRAPSSASSEGSIKSDSEGSVKSDVERERTKIQPKYEDDGRLFIHDAEHIVSSLKRIMGKTHKALNDKGWFKVDDLLQLPLLYGYSRADISDVVRTIGKDDFMLTTTDATLLIFYKHWESTSNYKQGKLDLDFLSRQLVWILRHDPRLPRDKNGFADLNVILDRPNLFGYKEEHVEEVVRMNDKQRFELKKYPNHWLIRCVQGHSVYVEQVGVEILPEKVDAYPYFIHGTYKQYVKSIEANGLKRMSRQHIHMTTTLPELGKVISGLRSDCDTVVKINTKVAMQQGIKFIKAANGVILSEGNKEGVIPYSCIEWIFPRKKAGEELKKEDAYLLKKRKQQGKPGSIFYDQASIEDKYKVIEPNAVKKEGDHFIVDGTVMETIIRPVAVIQFNELMQKKLRPVSKAKVERVLNSDNEDIVPVVQQHEVTEKLEVVKDEKPTLSTEPVVVKQRTPEQLKCIEVVKEHFKTNVAKSEVVQPVKSIGKNLGPSKFEGPNHQFYSNALVSQPEGALIDVMLVDWKGDYEKLEKHHGYIQWLFPIWSKGQNEQSTPLTEKEVAVMLKSDIISSRMIDAYKLFLDFLGLNFVEGTGKITRAEHWVERYKNWTINTHNNLRVSRMLYSLNIFGYSHLVKQFMIFIMTEIYVNDQLKKCAHSCERHWSKSIGKVAFSKLLKTLTTPKVVKKKLDQEVEQEYLRELTGVDSEIKTAEEVPIHVLQDIAEEYSDTQSSGSSESEATELKKDVEGDLIVR